MSRRLEIQETEMPGRLTSSTNKERWGQGEMVNMLLTGGITGDRKYKPEVAEPGRNYCLSYCNINPRIVQKNRRSHYNIFVHMTLCRISQVPSKPAQ